jgi:glycosyltransferase involved in cell wall biosynthesis
VAPARPPRLLVLGSPPPDAAWWHGLDVCYSSYASDWLQRADVVVLPAIVEHTPRPLLAALGHGVPVIATAACGLAPHALLTEVPAGDAPALRRALQQVLGATHGRADASRARQFTP